jgi:hypothetical protein
VFGVRAGSEAPPLDEREGSGDDLDQAPNIRVGWSW